MPPRYKFIYFDMKGRGELTRLIFAQGRIEYDDYRITRERWLTEFKSKMPFQQIPVLEFDGHVLAQSQAIAAYAAEITGLCGATPLDRAKARMFAEGAMEAYVEGAWYYFESDKEKKAKLREKFENDTLPRFRNNVEKLLAQNGSDDGWLVGSQLTYADLAVFHFFDGVQGLGMEATSSDTPQLARLLKKIKSEPNISQWLAKRPANPI
ncbi:glutathione S-transferase 1-like [Oscarella lobularis]|uniref:glutathione S-transferase 1-like n=1 Tax=Oscarella lobularis TaxID=121494 RepID=UPI0033138D97